MRKLFVVVSFQIALIAVVLCGAQTVQAQDGPPVWTTYTTRHGLGSNAVSSIAVDGDGHVWVGTFGGGVSRFNVHLQYRTWPG
jgi:sugar lactone lactonase YvrE